MDPTYIFNNLISKDYNNIIDNIYDDVDNIIQSLEKKYDYSYKIVKGTISSLVSFLRSTTQYDTQWLHITRELIIFLCKKNTDIPTKLEDGNTYNIIRVDSEHKIKLLTLYMIFFHYDARSARTRRTYTGVDFEFNQRKIALCQICFFSRRINKFVWVFDPNSLDSPQTKYLIDYMFTSKYIYKIGHGSDSLDIPYLFQELFMNNTTYIYSFITKVIDTRFLCEYQKNTVGGDKKCSIYDALLYFGTIDKKKYDELQNISMTMGPVQDVSWNVYNMSTWNLKYAAYDTIYLRSFYIDILRRAKKDTPELLNSYQYISLITRFVFLEKWEVTELLTRIKATVDPINNYIIKGKDGNVTLITVYNNVTKDMKIHINKLILYVNNLLDINYFRSSLTLLFKMVVYSILSNNFSIYKNKEEKFRDKIKLDDVFDTLKLIHLGKLRRLIKAYYITAQRKISNYFEM